MNSHWIPDKLDIIWQYITYIFSSILDVAFAISFLLFKNAPASFGKKKFNVLLFVCTLKESVSDF